MVGPALVMVPDLVHTPVATVFVLSCMCAAPLQSRKPPDVDPLAAPRSNPQCWDSSSALLLEMRSPRIADTVPAFWDTMVLLRSSDNGKHTALFWDLARVFWDLYLDCVLSASHGLGRRHVPALHSLITDESFTWKSSGSRSRVWFGVRVRPRGHIKTLKIKHRSNTLYYK